MGSQAESNCHQLGEDTTLECDLCDEDEPPSSDDDEGYTAVLLSLSDAWGRESRPQAPKLSVEVPEGAQYRMDRRKRASSTALRAIQDGLPSDLKASA